MAECILGCPDEYRVTITNRCGTQTVCDITDEVGAITFKRIMDDTGQADVTIALKGDGFSTCCECIGNIRSYLHSMVIYRDGESVWGPGPVVDIIYSKKTVTVSARDISAWLDARVIHNAHSFVNTPVLTIAKTLIEDALGPDDPCGLIQQIITIEPTGTPTLISRDYTANSQYAGDAIRELARTVLDFTVIGWSLVLAESLEFGPFSLLTENDFLTDIQVEERGLEAATKWYVTGSGVQVGISGAEDPIMGLIERLVNESSITDVKQLTAGATGRLKASNPPPVYINVPDGAALSQDAPVCFEQLVPGAEYGIFLDDVCRPVSIQHRLTGVSVSVNGKDETVGVTLLPVGINVGDASSTSASVGGA